MLAFPGYTITSLIRESLNSVVYRATNQASGQPVIIKVLKRAYPSTEEIAQFKHEYELIRKASPEGTLAILDIIDTGEKLALILENVEGVSLNTLIPHGFSIERFLELAIDLAHILGKLHYNSISHRHIKPRNIIINQQDNAMKLVNFGIDYEVSHIYEDIYTPEVIREELVYLSPEQTGRMNCAVDYRTDFYSLGVTLYEMLTGKPPFPVENAMQIIHAHIAQLPKRIDELIPDIPPVLSQIVIKLMAKSATQRYQNAFGLEADLRECLRQIRKTGKIDPFELGSQDISLKFIIPHIIVGRDKELNILRATFQKVLNGSMEVIMITGEPGIGKSSLVGEIQTYVVEAGAYFTSGKYEQFRQHVPYSSLIQAFQGLIRQILTEKEDRLQQWKDRILQAVGPNGRIITNAIPEFEYIIGPQSDVPELGPEENQNRFNRIFKNITQVFTDMDHPLVLFLDDLQWADNASINLLQIILNDTRQCPLLLIGSYRDNEIASHHPLMLALESLKKNGFKISTLRLDALKREDVNLFISTFLRCGKDESQPLADSILKKTGGNPFYVNQFLKMLYDERQIVLEPGRGWTWNLQLIENLDVTDNVVDFLAAKLKLLPAESLDLIKICACIGNSFNAATLSKLTSSSMEDVLSRLNHLTQEGLIDHRDNLFRFHHDRIQEAAYSLLSKLQREQMHYHIGNMALRQTPPDELEKSIFYITDHINQGKALITEQSERLALAGLNEKAGQHAKKSTAYKAAISYFREGITLLPQDAWQNCYSLSYGLHRVLMECEYLDRNFDEAQRLFRIILANASGKLDKARVYTSMVILYTDSRPPADAVKLGLEALELFGIKLSAAMGRLPMLKELIKAELALKRIRLKDIVHLPLMQEEERITIMNLMSTIGTPAYYVNTNLFAYISLYAVNQTLKYGLTSNSAVALIAFATILQIAHGDYQTGYRIGKIALELEELNEKNALVAGLVPHTFAFFIQHWKKHFKYDLDIYHRVYQISLNAGDYIYAGHSVNAQNETRLYMGEPLDDIYETLQGYQELMHIVKDPFTVSRYHETIQLIQNLRGLTPNRFSLNGPDFNHDELMERARNDGNLFALCGSQVIKSRILYLYGKYDQALQIAEELDTHIKFRIGTYYVSEHYCTYALTISALLARGVKSGKYRRIAKRLERKLARFSRLCPENFLHKYQLIRAEFISAGGRLEDALPLYHAAIENAHKQGFLHEEALAYECAAVAYHRRGFTQEASHFMNLAKICYHRWGAQAKIQDLLERYPEYMQTEITPGSHVSAENSPMQDTNRLDLTTVMQVSRIISSEIVLDKLIKKIMHVSAENAGAQKVFLILERDGMPAIEAAEVAGTEDIWSMMYPMPLDICDELSVPIINYVRRCKEDLILHDAEREGPFTNDPYIRQAHCKSILCTPILNKGKLIGTLYMENNLTTNAFTPERLEILRIITAQAAISLENAQLFELATLDGLTKLYVHRYFMQLLDQEVLRSNRYGQIFSLLMLDIDNFKSFNDTYGHQLGDEVLRQLAKTIRGNIRATDIPARYGGEEFIIILPDTDTEQAKIVAEKLRCAVERMEITFKDQILHLTISVGISTYGRNAREKDDLIKYADDALYDAKRSGKNKVCTVS